ncbi:MAG: hypothetical protein EBZ31_02490 [Flavobacteriia bacterium]|nr:hypothetical protein [Flavobacteriia bacterium]
MKRILLALAALCSLMSLAQTLPQQQVFGRHVISGVQAEDARAWLVQKSVLPEPAEWTLAFERESPGGLHVHFQAMLYGKPLSGAEAVVFLSPDAHVRGAQWAVLNALPQPPVQACDAAVLEEDGWRWVRWEDHQGYGPRFWERWAIDAETGVVLQQRDMLLHFTDSVGRALVFRPDPLAKAGVVYGGTYIDDNDQNSAVLDPLRDTVAVGLTYSNGLFSLSNSAAVIQEFDPPVLTVPTQTSSDFFYSRSDAGFEMTNALYHLERIKARLDSLGFGSLMTYAIPVDVNAFSGQDNSAFDRSTNPPRLFFGEGGVDDAEDSDVLAHEYGHALSHAAAPFTVNGTERECLEEALCDYFAMSHSFRWEPWRHTYIFNWDGHNPFWGGRMGSSTKDYSQLTFSSIYSHTDVFADPLGATMAAIGPNAMDRIVLESLYNFTSFMTMPQAANWMLLADTVLNGGQNASLLHLNFAARNILSPQVSLEEAPSIPRPSSFVLAAQDPWPFADVAGVLYDVQGRKVAEWTTTSSASWPTLPAGRYIGSWANGQAFTVLVRP